MNSGVLLGALALGGVGLAYALSRQTSESAPSSPPEPPAGKADIVSDFSAGGGYLATPAAERAYQAAVRAAASRAGAPTGAPTGGTTAASQIAYQSAVRSAASRASAGHLADLRAFAAAEADRAQAVADANARIAYAAARGEPLPAGPQTLGCQTYALRATEAYRAGVRSVSALVTALGPAPSGCAWIESSWGLAP